MPQSKTCTKCCQILPAESFSKSARHKSGLQSSCKACSSVTNRAYYQANREEATAAARSHYQENKESIIAHSRAYHLQNRERLNANSRAYYQENKESINAYKRAYHLQNKEAENTRSRAYQKSHPEVFAKARHTRRANRLDNGIFAITSKELKRIQSSPCTHCSSTTNIHVDHVIPLSKGGRHSIGNLQALCQSCNTSKSASFYAVFRYRCENPKDTPDLTQDTI